VFVKVPAFCLIQNDGFSQIGASPGARISDVRSAPRAVSPCRRLLPLGMVQRPLGNAIGVVYFGHDPSA
jgi:hypothetical protein